MQQCFHRIVLSMRVMHRGDQFPLSILSPFSVVIFEEDDMVPSVFI